MSSTQAVHERYFMKVETWKSGMEKKSLRLNKGNVKDWCLAQNWACQEVWQGTF